MIYLNLNIRNPWFDRFENVWNNTGKITKWKWWEVEILKTENFLRFEFHYTVMQDHAGIQLELGLFGWECHAGMHDTRHWDYENKCWVVYGESD